jgi:L-ascorbate metabolism protein UlaG (beta-lactamase superfamily)
MSATYLGCGGIYIVSSNTGILIDPFFSNQSAFRIGRSIFARKSGKAVIKPSEEMIGLGLSAITRHHPAVTPTAIVNAHSHYDHLMDIPAVYHAFEKKPKLLLTNSGHNICHAVVDSTDVTILEEHITTHKEVGHPIIIHGEEGRRVKIYPILSDHNPHLRHIKFFSGEQSNRVDSFNDPMQKTKANLWLEGNTFSFIIDFLGDDEAIETRIFVQSSSCNAPAGLPPTSLLSEHPIDIAFIGIVSYAFSADFPCSLLEALQPRQIVWVHWEDFFRRYDRRPKTIRGTDIPGFFEIPCVIPYKKSGKMLWPRVMMEVVY